MSRPTTEAISPFFIVADVTATTAFYRDKLGFETRFEEPATGPFFAIVGRDGAQLLLKAEAGLAPLPNPERHASMRWMGPLVSGSGRDGLGGGLTIAFSFRNDHESEGT